MSQILVIGAGPAGLAAAESGAALGKTVTVVETSRAPGRKFLLAGRSGLNLTHSEPDAVMAGRYRGSAADHVRRTIAAHPPELLRQWASELGEPTFAGSSGRVFPASLRATPLLRSWLQSLAARGVQLQTELRWDGWSSDGGTRLVGVGRRTGEELVVHPTAVVLALGGASWPRTGSAGGWVDVLRARGVRVESLEPSNVGLLVRWSDAVLRRFEGEALKHVVMSYHEVRISGDLVVTKRGLHGGPAYSLSAAVGRDLRIGGPSGESEEGPSSVEVFVDFLPDRSAEQIAGLLARVRPGDSLSNRLRKSGISPAAAAVLMEFGARAANGPAELSALMKRCPIVVAGTEEIDRAISSQGGVHMTSMTAEGELIACPGVFLAGEMLDWDAPTGGYLLQACFSTGWFAGAAAASYVDRFVPKVDGRGDLEG